jgi:hypothetical protein
MAMRISAGIFDRNGDAAMFAVRMRRVAVLREEVLVVAECF